MRDAAARRGRLRARGTDQEGGEIRNLTWARPVEGQAAAATPARATADARGAARDLRAAGVNVNLAPVGDVARAPAR